MGDDNTGAVIAIIALVLALGAIGLIMTSNTNSIQFLTANGSRSLTANWNVGVHNITASWFIGNFQGMIVGTIQRSNVTDFWASPFWSQIPDKPGTFSPSAHTQSFSTIYGSSYITASNITGFASSVRGEISGVSPIIYYSSTGQISLGTLTLAFSNISGVASPSQIPTLALISANITDWGSYINQQVLTSSIPNFNGLKIGGGNNVNLGIEVSNGGGSTAYLGIATTYRNYQFLVSDFGSGFTLNELPDYFISSPITIMQIQDSTHNIVFNYPVTGYYISGDYGIAWTTISLPSGINGMQLTAYNTNSGVLASRLYIYSNGAWRYVMIT